MPRPNNNKSGRKPFGQKSTGRPTGYTGGQNRGPGASQPPKRRPTKGRRPQARVNFNQEGERLQKVLAAAGVASRREAEQLILEGRVEVDGQTVTELGTRVDRQKQHIQVDGEALAKPRLAYFAVNKPEGIVCTASDPAGRTLVTDLLPPEVGRMFNVGRLDIASEGLILVTNDGALANQLTHPRHGVEKTYEVQVAGDLNVEVLGTLRKGVHLAEGFVQVVHVRIKSRRRNGTILEMVLDEGRNREIRRLLAKVGHRVQRLTRIAVGPIRLGEMPKGASRRLTPEEVRKLHEYISESEKKPRREKGKLEEPTTRQGDFDWKQRKRQAAAGKAASGPTSNRPNNRTNKTKRDRR